MCVINNPAISACLQNEVFLRLRHADYGKNDRKYGYRGANLYNSVISRNQNGHKKTFIYKKKDTFVPFLHEDTGTLSGFHAHFCETGGGIKEMGGNPKDGPVFGIAATQFVHVVHVAALGKVGVLELFAL